MDLSSVEIASRIDWRDIDAPLMGFRPAHPNRSKMAGLTGQIMRYLNRTYRVLATLFVFFLLEKQKPCYAPLVMNNARDRAERMVCAAFRAPVKAYYTARDRFNRQAQPRKSFCVQGVTITN